MTKLQKLCNSIRYNISRITTITEKNIKVQMRFKFNLIYSIINPFLTILITLIVLIKFFATGTALGQWNETNYLVFIFTAYNIELLRRVIREFPNDFRQEKYWKTLPGLMIAPFNIAHLLFAIIFSHLIIISFPFVIFFTITWFISPISSITVIFIIIIFLLIDIIFSGIGLFLGVFAISGENYWRVFDVGFQLLFYASCVTYPFEMFPEVIQPIIWLNPFFHMFDLIRNAWLYNNILLTMTSYHFQFLILIGMAIIIPLVSIYLFKRIYDKLGIVGY